jgi:hypothetical protein
MTMTKTAAPRVRQTNLYTVEQDGLPVAQALAISQAEAVRLYVESVQQPTMTARLSSPLEARTLAGLPLLQREPAATDDKTLGLFDDVPVAPASRVVGTFVDLTRAPSGDPVTVLDGADAQATCCEKGPPGGVCDECAEISAGYSSAMAPDRREPAAKQPVEPADCLDAAPAAVKPDGVGLAVAELASLEYDELLRQAAQAAVRRANGGKPIAMYRNPADGASWSGCGLKPRWLVEALEAGRSQDEFLIEGAQA